MGRLPLQIGGLYVRAGPALSRAEGTPIRKWMDGGFQEFDLRPGVENIPGAVGSYIQEARNSQITLFI